jgi:hypothetical protein
MIDLSLQLKTQFEASESKWSEKKNPTIKFSELRQDSLGNPLQITVKFPQEYAHSSNLSKFFGKLAERIVWIKTHHDLPKDFMSLEKYRTKSTKGSSSEYHYRRRTRKNKTILH